MEAPARKWRFKGRVVDPLAIACLIVFLAATTLRLLAIFNELWLDEIWSWNLSRLVSSPIEILTTLTSDNNHPLNTFFLWTLGDRQSWVSYRLLSLVSGVSSVAVMGIIGRRYGRTESFTALILGGFSYFMILYSSEARGYAPAAFFALVGFLLTEKVDAGTQWGCRGSFWLTVLCGLLSHSTYLFAYSGLFVWSALRIIKTRLQTGQIILEILRTQGIPLTFVAAHIVWLTTLSVGGGPEYSVWGVISETVRFAFGLLDIGFLAVVGSLAAAVLFLWELWTLGRDAPDQAAFFLTTILIAPALILIVSNPAVLFPRYFLVCLPFFLLLLTRGIARLARKGTPGKTVSATLLALYCSFNLLHFADLMRYGRGNYSMALSSIARQTKGDRVSIGSDHDFRNQMVIEFYSRYRPAGKTIDYVPETGIRPDSAPEWVIVHRLAADPPTPPAPRFLLPNGSEYVLNDVFPSSAPSGIWWFLYQKTN